GRTFAMAALTLAVGLSLSACGHDPNRASGQSRINEGQTQGTGFLGWFGSDRDGERRGSGGEAETRIGVKSFLWRASLDTLSFMPLASADPFGGVIITDWYADPAVPGERFKATVYILDTRLRADALNVSIFKQVQTNGAWADAAVTPETESQIEN